MQTIETHSPRLGPTNRVEYEPALHLLNLAAHEIRGPLTRLKGYVELLQSEALNGDLSPTLIEHTLTQMNRAVDSAAELIKHFTEAAVSASYQSEFDWRPLDLWKLVVEVALRYPEVNLVQIDTPGIVNGSTEQLERVLINLLENARKYSPDDGCVCVILRSSGGGVLLQVVDQGIGLPPGSAETIFELYSRAANAIALEIPGQGLGLHIARRIVEEHAGRIWAHSDGEGAGTMFSVWLPAASPTGAATPEPPG